MQYLLYRLFVLLAIATSLQGQEEIRNHSTWRDTQGNVIDCHEGGILQVGNTFYWYGRAYKGNVDGIYGAGGARFRCGFNCYSSTNLTSWTFRGAVLTYPTKGFLTKGTWHRPRVIHNAQTGKYVLWFFMFPTGTQRPTTMVVATASTPTGPFTVLTGPEFGQSGDLALFQDQDGKGYIAYDDRRSIRVTQLTPDFQNLANATTVALQAGEGKKYEGSSMIRYKGKYVVAGSGVEGLNPTDTTYAVADSPLGPYANKGLMSQQKTWNSQLSAFFYLAESDQLIALCEQWLIGPKGERVPAELSCQLWLPVKFDANTGVARMQHVQQWNPWTPDPATRNPGVAKEKAALVPGIFPGEDIQSRVNAAPPGTTFLLKSGLHRMQSIVPKSGDTFIGEPGTVLSGARLLTKFVRSGPYWVATNQTHQEKMGEAPCRNGYPRCNYPEDLFINDVPLLHVAALTNVGPGKWHFDYATDKIYLGEDPTAKNVELSVTPRAFGGSATNVTIRRMTIEKYNNPTQEGAVELGKGWIIEDCEVRWNHFTGIATGPRSIARRNHVHHNGCFGFHGAGENILVENNEIAHNGYAGYDPYWGAGGSKWVYTSHLIVRGNFSHHNRGPGLWTDINNIHSLYENNKVEDNERGGIFHEISYDAVIRTNTARRNGTGKGYPGWTTGAGIEITTSRNVEVYGNVIEDNWQGITGLDDHRGTGNAGPWTLTNLNVHDNVVTSRVEDAGGGRSGIIDTKGTNAFSAGAHNRFHHNAYSLGKKRQYFFWMGKELDENEWRRFGQDESGTVQR